VVQLIGRGLIAVALAALTSVTPAVAGTAKQEQVVDTVRAMLTTDIGLPLPDSVNVYIYDTREKFRQGLIDEAWVNPQGVDELAAFAVGLARPGRVLLNGRAARGQQEWVRLVAHELTHVAQFHLAGGEGRAEQWLAEGMAEHVAYQVLERLGRGTLAEHRAVARAGARNQTAFARARLDLQTLGSPRGFTLRHQREGSVETYHLAFLMVDYLIEREGFGQVVNYLGRLKSEARAPAFRAAFKQSIEEFEGEVLLHMQQSLD
jgi:hypothetical protein